MKLTGLFQLATLFSGTPAGPPHVSPAAPASPQVAASEVGTVIGDTTPDATLGSPRVVASIGQSSPATLLVASSASSSPVAGPPSPAPSAVARGPPLGFSRLPPTGVVRVPPMDNAHSKCTRGKDGFRQPKKVFDL
jgi:hypothetical protein